jgi:8-oxo-dGTP pyrophosphatase MutT (NUDIX family)
MPRKKMPTAKPKVRTEDQVSAGGVAFRRRGRGIQVAIVAVNPSRRWQLPKGLVDPGESPEQAAVREVREEAGVETDLMGLIQTIEYWYRAERRGEAVRYHKFVHFFLLSYRAGDVSQHDHEVAEARWVSGRQAVEMLAFASERSVVEKAVEMISELDETKG